MKRLIAVLLLALGWCSASQAQCQLNVTSPNITDTPNVTAPVPDFKTVSIRGGGSGPWDSLSNPPDNYNFYYVPNTGAFTINVRATGISAEGSPANNPQSGILAVTSSSTVYVGIAVSIWQGNYYVTYGADVRVGGRWTGGSNSTLISNPATTPIWLQLSRTGGAGSTWTASTSSNGVNWTAVWTSSLPRTGWTDPTNIGFFAAAGSPDSAGNYTEATFDNVTINGAAPAGMHDIDSGTTQFVGSAQPVIPWAMSDVGSGYFNFADNGQCSSTQLQAIAAAEQNGSYQMQTSILLYDNNSNDEPLITSTNGPLVCAQCSSSSTATGIASNLFTGDPGAYTYDVGVTGAFDSVFTSTLAAQGVTPNYHPYSKNNILEEATVYSKNQGGSNGIWALGPVPDHWCTSDSIAPDFSPVIAKSTIDWPYFSGISICKRPKGSPVGTLWSCAPTTSPFAYGNGSPNKKKCTNYDLNVVGEYP
jgi:hypothetical protein